MPSDAAAPNMALSAWYEATSAASRLSSASRTESHHSSRLSRCTASVTTSSKARFAESLGCSGADAGTDCYVMPCARDSTARNT